MSKHGSSGMRIIDTDKGWKKLRKEIAKSRGKPHVAVGFLGAKATAEHVSSKLTVAQIASIHEFGLGNVPERSMIRGTVDEHATDIAIMAKNVGSKVLSLDMTLGRALGLLGAYVQGEMVQRINNSIPPPLKEETVRRKGSSKPLIDTGQMKGALAWEVRE